jgi:hypothetical protein
VEIGAVSSGVAAGDSRTQSSLGAGLWRPHLPEHALGDAHGIHGVWVCAYIQLRYNCAHAYNCAKIARMPAFTFTFAIAHPSHLSRSPHDYK